MKRFLKVILILAAVFGATGLGLTAGGAAMGATMGDIGALITESPRYFISWIIKTAGMKRIPKQLWMGRMRILWQMQRRQ